jgi:hypothetical protein
LTDLDRLLRRLDELQPRDFWPRVGSPGYGDANTAVSRPPGRRLAAAVTAIAVAFVGTGLAVVAFRRSPPESMSADPSAFVVSASFPGTQNPSLFFVTEGGRAIPFADTTGSWSPAVSPDGRLLAYQRELRGGRSALTVATLNGSRPPRDLHIGAISAAPAWSPDGRRIAIVDGNEIWLIPVDGSGPQVLGFEDRFPRSVAWSPDGKQLAFSDSSVATMVGGCLAKGSTGIWVVSADASRTRHLTHEGCWSVAWSPLGSFLVATGSDFRPVLVDPETGAVTRLEESPQADASSTPRFSSDGRLIAFAAGEEGIWIHDTVTGTWQRFPVEGDLDVHGLSFVPRGAPRPPVVDEELCDFPSVRPTYLPWLAPGETVPEPARQMNAAGGGPQGLDPGYSILSWSNGDITQPGSDPNVAGIHLWRATESGDSFPEDPQVPPLPDGSTGRLHPGHEDGDWSIVWGDPTPDVTDDDCSETTLVAYYPNLTKAEGKEEILLIARSLVPAGTETETRSVSEVFVPPTRQEGDLTILPLVFPDGSRAELAYPTELRLAELGLSPNILGDLGECGSDPIITPLRQHGEIYIGAEPLSVSEGASRVELWRGGRGWAGHYLVVDFGSWWFHMPCVGPVSDATVERWGGSLRGHVTPEGFLVVSGGEGLRFGGPEAGPSFGPEFYSVGGRDAPGLVVLGLAERCPSGPDEDREPGYARRCDEVGEGAIQITVQTDRVGAEAERFIDDVIDLVEIRDIELV